ncbi:MAG: hypothetical protein QOH16_3449, partial [Gaiellaceae bacterium]|nr:hypothetical protein [Gaiellaceae bacterium]
MRALRRRLPRRLACFAVLCGALCLPAAASASVILGDRDVVRPTLSVNARGVALV